MRNGSGVQTLPVTRPGRCAAHVEFRAFTEVEAAAWLRARGQTPREGGGTLATLYARAAGHELPARRPVGFRLEN